MRLLPRQSRHRHLFLQIWIFAGLSAVAGCMMFVTDGEARVALAFIAAINFVGFLIVGAIYLLHGEHRES